MAMLLSWQPRLLATRRMGPGTRSLPSGAGGAQSQPPVGFRAPRSGTSGSCKSSWRPSPLRAALRLRLRPASRAFTRPGPASAPLLRAAPTAACSA
eukprot:13445819-Alexandrium_andersonii.AAC.1